MAACWSLGQFFANLRWLHVMTVENLVSHQIIKDCLSFHVRIQLHCCKQKQNLLYFERHRHVDFASRKVHNFERGRCSANKNLHGKEGKFGLNIFSRFCSQFKFEKKCFQDRQAAIFFIMADWEEAFYCIFDMLKRGWSFWMALNTTAISLFGIATAHPNDAFCVGVGSLKGKHWAGPEWYKVCISKYSIALSLNSCRHCYEINKTAGRAIEYFDVCIF